MSRPRIPGQPIPFTRRAIILRCPRTRMAKTLTQWADALGVPYTTLRSRFNSVANSYGLGGLLISGHPQHVADKLADMNPATIEFILRPDKVTAELKQKLKQQFIEAKPAKPIKPVTGQRARDPLEALSFHQIEFLRAWARESKVNFTDLRKKLKNRVLLDELMQYYDAQVSSQEEPHTGPEIDSEVELEGAYKYVRFIDLPEGSTCLYIPSNYEISQNRGAYVLIRKLSHDRAEVISEDGTMNTTETLYINGAQRKKLVLVPNTP